MIHPISVALFQYLVLIIFIVTGMANRPAPRAGNGGGPNKTCQFKLVLLGESAVGMFLIVV